jgi:hypothetical protein
MTDNTQGQGHFGTHYLLNKLRRLREGRAEAAPEMEAQMFARIQEPVVGSGGGSDGEVTLLVYPHNPLYGLPQARTLPAADAQPGLVNARVRIVSDDALAVPDADGHYRPAPGTPQFDQVNAFYFVTFTLRMFERFAYREIPWSFLSPRILVKPRVGSEANAFYNERTNTLGFHTFRTLEGQQASTARFADIVAHETAHAVLDSVRDLWNESFGLGCRAIHESFGDMAAVLVALHDEALVRDVLEWTRGDMRVSSVISQLAESMYPVYGESDGTLYLRNALNDFGYVPPRALSYVVTDPETTLGRQEHNFSRVLTGALYDIFAAIYGVYRTQQGDLAALQHARDTLGELLMLALECAPVGEADYADMACAMLDADRLLNTRHHDLIQDAFIRRGILSAAAAAACASRAQALPEVYLPSGISTSLQASLFMEQTLLPALGWRLENDVLPMSLTRDSRGFTTMTFFRTRQITLAEAHFADIQGAVVDAYEGLTFVFDEQNRLVHALQRLISDDDIAIIKLSVLDLLIHKRITDRLHHEGATPTSPSPKALFIPGTTNGEEVPPRLVKYPSLIDTVPANRRTFREYLREWSAPPA